MTPKTGLATALVAAVVAALVTAATLLVIWRVAPGVVYTTFHHAGTGANVVTTEFSDWATNCPEYKVTAVQVRRTNHPSDWQEQYFETKRATTRIAAASDAAE